MPNYPMSEPGSWNSAAGRNESLREDMLLPRTDTVAESNLAELAALFAANNGGAFSLDLALEVVLNEIVEQACLATGATGAAIGLERGSEMVCRASGGTTAPELGAQLDSAAGITGECLRTRQVQRCDDAHDDPRADLEASQRLGIRSIMVLPLLRDAAVVGVFEVFSTRPYAFGDRDQRTLEVLAGRVIRNLEHLDESVNSISEPTPVAPISSTYPEIKPESRDEKVRESTTDSRAVAVMTWALGLTVLVFAVLLGALVANRLGWMGEIARARSTKTKSPVADRATGALSQGTPSPGQGSAAGSLSSKSGVEQSAGKKDASSSSSNSSGEGPGSRPLRQRSTPPPGSLLVYDNGREVFRMPPSKDQTDATDHDGGDGVQLAASVDQEDAMKLSSAAAEQSLLRRVEPEYPEEARQQKIEGSVVLDIHIRADGGVQEVKLVSGPSLLARAAIEAVKQWRFKPREVSGHLTEMQTRVTLNFTLPH